MTTPPKNKKVEGSSPPRLTLLDETIFESCGAVVCAGICALIKIRLTAMTSKYSRNSHSVPKLDTQHDKKREKEIRREEKSLKKFNKKEKKVKRMAEERVTVLHFSGKEDFFASGSYKPKHMQPALDVTWQ
jgi:hypothetical protein